MSVINALAREHRLFEKLLARLRAAAELGGEPGRERIAESLLVLLPALERHDGIETLVFDGQPAELPDEERRAHQLVEAQHSIIRVLRAEIEEILRSETEARFQRLAGLAEALAAKLEWHLKTEELLLWPLCAKRAGRSVRRSLEREAEKSVRALEASVSRLDAPRGTAESPW